MSKKYLVASICLGLALAGFLGVHYLRQRPKVLSENVMVEEVKVIVRDDGFDPPEVTIKPGMAVRWVNNTSAAQSSINSDNYPDNKLYPELNLGKFEKDQTLVHIFTKSGTYTYHDHFHPEHKGSIKVQ